MKKNICFGDIVTGGPLDQVLIQTCGELIIGGAFSVVSFSWLFSLISGKLLVEDIFEIWDTDRFQNGQSAGTGYCWDVGVLAPDLDGVLALEDVSWEDADPCSGGVFDNEGHRLDCEEDRGCWLDCEVGDAPPGQVGDTLPGEQEPLDLERTELFALLIKIMCLLYHVWWVGCGMGVTTKTYY